MKLATILLAASVLTACGGGADGPVAIAKPNILQQLQVAKPVKMAALQGANGKAIWLYQALYGKAPSNAMLVSYVNQIGTSDGSTWADAMAADLKAMSNADLAALVLNNISVAPATLNTTATFGTGQQAYDALKSALTDYFNWTGITRRGTVVLQLATIIAGMEGETQFGVYGNAAVAFNKQSTANLNYAVVATNQQSAKVAVPYAVYKISYENKNASYVVPLTFPASASAGQGQPAPLATGQADFFQNGKITVFTANINYLGTL